MAIIAKVTIVGKNEPVVLTQEQPQAQPFSDVRKKAKPTVEEKPIKQPKPVEPSKPTLAVQRNINTVYSDKIDVSKPSKYTEHFLK